MSVYYNENDPKAAAWLRELIRKGQIAKGDVDERSIEDVRPDDLKGFVQCHFFAGIGVWSYALRLAGWPDDRPVWIGSCPCQPFSAAGKRKGTADERHLWPAWQWLIGKCRPSVIFGEQVESKDGRTWLDLVSTDLEGEGYRVGPIVLPAAGVGAPHTRHRLWFVADSASGGHNGRRPSQNSNKLLFGRETPIGPSVLSETEGRSDARDVADPDSKGRQGSRPTPEKGRSVAPFVSPVGSRELGNARGERRIGEQLQLYGWRQEQASAEAAGPGPVNGFWRDADWIFCRDEKWRPVEPGTFPLVNGLAGRVGLLRGYGNAIVPQAAAEVIASYMSLEAA